MQTHYDFGPVTAQAEFPMDGPLERWKGVPVLHLQAFGARAEAHPITDADWRRQNAAINRLALVCKGAILYCNALRNMS